MVVVVEVISCRGSSGCPELPACTSPSPKPRRGGESRPHPRTILRPKGRSRPPRTPPAPRRATARKVIEERQSSGRSSSTSDPRRAVHPLHPISGMAGGDRGRPVRGDLRCRGEILRVPSWPADSNPRVECRRLAPSAGLQAPLTSLYDDLDSPTAGRLPPLRPSPPPSNERHVLPSADACEDAPSALPCRRPLYL